jgi:hypothetical protein
VDVDASNFTAFLQASSECLRSSSSSPTSWPLYLTWLIRFYFCAFGIDSMRLASFQFPQHGAPGRRRDPARSQRRATRHGSTASGSYRGVQGIFHLFSPFLRLFSFVKKNHPNCSIRINMMDQYWTNRLLCTEIM